MTREYAGCDPPGAACPPSAGTLTATRYAGLGLAYEMAGELNLARSTFQHDLSLRPTHHLVQVNQARIDARLGHDAEARRTLADLVEASAIEPVGPYHIGTIYAALGDADGAFAWLERAYRERSDWLPFLAVDPWYDSLRGDARFTDLLRQLKLPTRSER